MILRLFLIALLCAAPFCAFAADNGEKLRKIQDELDIQQRQDSELQQKEKEAAADVQGLRAKLIAATAELQEKEKEQDALEDKLQDLEDEAAAKQAALDKKRQQLQVLTDILIRLSRTPPAAYFLRTTITADYIHRAILLRSLLPRLREETDAAMRDLAELEDLHARTAEQQRLVAAAQQNLEWQRHDLDQLVRMRQGLLNRTAAQRQAIAKRLVSLTDEAKDIQQLMDRVAPHAKKHVGPALNPALKWPVAGPVVKGFGSRDADGVTSAGLTLAAPSGSAVVAPLAGRVVFAGPFRGYGQILILQHKGGYHSFLAGFGRIDAEMGQEVAAGEPLGLMPVKSGSRPELYFEWRYNGEPIDPMEGISRNKAAIAAEVPGR